MAHIVPISEARASLGELVDTARDQEVYLVKHGRPVGVLVSVEAWENALNRIEDLEDSLAVFQRDHDTIPFEPSAAAEPAHA